MSSGGFTECVVASVCQSHSCTLCLQYLPDRVGDLADTETAGGLWWLPSIVPPHVPLHLRHKLEGLSHFGPVLLLLWPHRIQSVHVSGQCATPSNNRIRSVSDQFLQVHTSDMQHVKKLRRATGPDFVSLNPLPVQSRSARAVVSLRDHKHTVKLVLSQRTLICSCIRKTKKHTCWIDWLVVSLTSVLIIVHCDQKSYDWEDGADEGLTWHELVRFEREKACELRREEIFSWTGVKLSEERNRTGEQQESKKGRSP